MITHSEIQGTPAWLALRRDYFTASEAAAVMGDSPYCTRTQLLQQKATGITPEIDARTQARFDAGHAAEAAFRPIAERIVGVDFYPVTGSIEIDGLKLLASFDGISADDSVLFEHKLFSQRLADMCMNMGDVTDPAYYWQLEHQLLVSQAERVEFFTSDGTDSKFAQTTYTAKQDRRDALIAAWKQFAVDLAEYVPAEYVAPAPSGRAPETLPALHIELSGIVTASNLQVYKDTALAVFAGINRELTTDQHFSDADIEDRIKAAKQHALSQTESIDLLFRTMDEISEEARTVRLDLDKLVKHRKEAVRTEIVDEGRRLLMAHVEALNVCFGKPYLPGVAADFAGAIKGKKSLDSMRDAASRTLANAKIDANRRAETIFQNLNFLESKARDCMSIFADKSQLLLHEHELFALKVDARIADHKAKEEKRIEAERERIRAEEVKKINDAAAAEVKRLADEYTAHVAREAAALAAVPVSQPKPEEVAQVAPAVVSIPPDKPSRSFGGSLVCSSEPSATVLAFLASRHWPTKASYDTARAILIEYEKFCAQQLKVAA